MPDWLLLLLAPALVAIVALPLLFIGCTRVRIWPTTVVVDEGGMVAAVEVGTDPGALDMLGRA